MTLFFVNIAWMKFYAGESKIEGQFSYIKEKGYGWETCNFLDVKGAVFGYVPKSLGINIDRLGGKRESDHVSGVTVVWVSKPKNGRRVVIGWYKNATVYKEPQVPDEWLSDKHKRTKIKRYSIVAKKDNVTILSEEERVLEIPDAVTYTGGMGRSAVTWFADNPNSDNRVKDFLGKMEKRIKYHNPRKSNEISRRTKFGNADPEHKALVEQFAVEKTKDHFKSKKYKMESVERDNCGYDLKATKGAETLCIEVKGLSGSEPVVQLTPNEYRTFCKQDNSYRLAIVTSALDEPRLSICRWLREKLVVEKSPKMRVKVTEIKGGAIHLCEI